MSEGSHCRSAKAVIFGGSGYIGTWTWKRLLSRFGHIILADIRPPSELLPRGVSYEYCDVRQPIDLNASPSLKSSSEGEIEWIFNYAAIHREPGHDFAEYFDTNLPGAKNVLAFAEKQQVTNIFFASSIAVYGQTTQATDESKTKYPSSAYGTSKLVAELMHERWAAASAERRLICCRPGVVYGAGDPGNILRMITAVNKRLFFFPGNPRVHKSYAYIEGLLDSIDFTMDHPDKVIHYNYVESPTEPLNELVRHVEELQKKKSLVFSLPIWLLLPVAQIMQWLTSGRSPIHPARVRKASMPTHIIPDWLAEQGFVFRYDFRKSLEDWKMKSPRDFNF